MMARTLAAADPAGVGVGCALVSAELLPHCIPIHKARLRGQGVWGLDGGRAGVGRVTRDGYASEMPVVASSRSLLRSAHLSNLTILLKASLTLRDPLPPHVSAAHQSFLSPNLSLPDPHRTPKQPHRPTGQQQPISTLLGRRVCSSRGRRWWSTRTRAARDGTGAWTACRRSPSIWSATAGRAMSR